MWIALLLIASLAEWVPARWTSSDPQSIDLIEKTPVNCLLLEPDQWTPELAGAAEEKGIATLGVIAPKAPAGSIEAAKAAGLTGIVLEGSFEKAERKTLRREAEKTGLKVIELVERTSLDLESADPVLGTWQGVWPGVHTADDGSAKAAPTGAPWIDTNTGFLRFLNARTDSMLWIGIRPPEGGEITKLSRYHQAIGDAALVGARWIVALDADFSRRLLKGEEDAVNDWTAMGQHLRFWEEHREWTGHPPYGQLVLVQDVASGGLLSNGIIDMLAARHTPLRTVPPPELKPQAVEGARIALDIDPPALTNEQKEVLRGFARGGGMLLSAPPGWEIEQNPGQVTVAEGDVDKLDNVWRGINMTIGRSNLGVRLFNVATMRSELVAPPGGTTAYLHLVNYSDYPVDNITIRPQQNYRKATLHAPGKEPVELEIFENGEIDIELIEASAIVVLEGAAGLTAAEAHGGHH